MKHHHSQDDIGFAAFLAFVQRGGFGPHTRKSATNASAFWRKEDAGRKDREKEDHR